MFLSYEVFLIKYCHCSENYLQVSGNEILHAMSSDH